MGTWPSRNEYADCLIKVGVDSRAIAPISMMKKNILRIIKEKEKTTVNNEWENFESKNIKLFLLDISAINAFLKSSPTLALCQLVSGHTILNDFVCKKLGLLRSAMCECKNDNETLSHFLFECILYDELRAEIWEDFEPTYEYIIQDWEKLRIFVTRIGRFEKNIRENLEERNKVETVCGD